MSMVIDISTWGWPQWTYIVLSLLTFIGHVVNHGKPRTAHNGYVGLSNFLVAFILLAAGGFLA